VKQDLESIWKKTCLSAGVFLEKVPSRKFLAWTVATHMTYTGILKPDSWMMITMLFLGTQAVLDWSKKDVPTREQE
jgi:pyrroloquinoline quinone (PQQ) biosynthesis protein C